MSCSRSTVSRQSARQHHAILRCVEPLCCPLVVERIKDHCFYYFQLKLGISCVG